MTLNYIREGNYASQEKKSFIRLCNELTSYADGMDEDCYYDIKDLVWYKKSYTNLCKGFNHLQNFIDCQQITSINNKPICIVDSFLCLSTMNGQYEFSEYDTVNEMLKNLYCP